MLAAVLYICHLPNIACEFWRLACLIKHVSFYKEVKKYTHSLRWFQFGSGKIVESQFEVIPSENMLWPCHLWKNALCDFFMWDDLLRR